MSSRSEDAAEDSAEEARSHGEMLFGYLLLGLQPLPVAWLAAHGVSTATSVFARFLFALVAIGLICGIRRRGLRIGNPRVLLLRGVLGGIAVLLYFYSIGHAGAARGTLLNYTYPFWANVMGWALGERPARALWPLLFVATAGVWCVVAPEGGGESRGVGLGELAGITSAMFAGGAVLTIKKLRKTDESLTIVLSFSICGLILSAPWASFETSRLFGEPELFAALAAVGALSFFGHVLFTRAYRRVTLARGTLMSLSVPAFATVGGALFLGESLTPRFLLGASLILSALGASLWIKVSR